MRGDKTGSHTFRDQEDPADCHPLYFLLPLMKGEMEMKIFNVVKTGFALYGFLVFTSALMDGYSKKEELLEPVHPVFSKKGIIQKAVKTYLTPEKEKWSFEFFTADAADTVLLDLKESIEVIGVATVADLYDMIGKVGTYEDAHRGWTDLSEVLVRKTSRKIFDKYYFCLPTPKKLL